MKLGLVVLVALFVVVPLASATDRTASISGFEFIPGTLSAEAGDTVTWTNEDGATHTVTCDLGSCPYDSGNMGRDDTFTATLVGSGTQIYHCEFHGGMVGQLFVGSNSAADADLAPDASTLAASRPLIAGAFPDPRSALLSVTVRNDGGAASSASFVQFFTTDATGADALIGTASLGALAPGAATTVSVTWANPPLFGDAPARVVVDPTNAAVEATESNNEAARTVHVGIL